mmetsp:Transcript_80270/g.126638  ORF Transcript_80270/g.126638 Transcript_80270/m.126638 type:complete len:227 (-) Transcript_80270:897-1577(-)
MMTEDVTFLQHLHQILVMSQIVQPVLCLRFAYDVSLDSQWAVASSPGAASCRAPVAKLAERIATDVIQLVLATAIRLVVRPTLPMSMELAKPAVLSATAATVLDQEIVMMEDVSLAMEKTGLVAVGLAHLTAVAVTSLELKTATQENVILRTPTMDTTALRAAHSVLLAIQLDLDFVTNVFRHILPTTTRHAKLVPKTATAALMPPTKGASSASVDMSSTGSTSVQ